MRARLWILLFAALASGFVIVGSLLPGGLGWSPIRPPVLAHFLAYGLMGGLFAVWVGGRGSRVIGVVLALSLLGLLLEVGQIPIPKRSFFWGDVLANLSGAGLGAGLGWLSLILMRRWRARAGRGREAGG
jgi:VanZ family protein